MSFLIIVIALIFIFNMEWFTIMKSGDMEMIQKFLEKELPVTLFIMLLLMVIQNLFTLIPIIIIIMVNVVLFGFVNGYLWSVVSSIIGASFSFILYRYWFQSYLLRKANPSLIEKLEQNGFFFVFLMRLFPFAPSSIINTASGISSIKMSHFLLATTLGNMLYLGLLSAITIGLLSEEIQGYLIISLLLAFIPSYFLYRKFKPGGTGVKKWKVKGH
ncbi:TVP38/TMEM64 family protein [Sutcliffiella deserti]|uniref:TVP38/TMEM64 family protein n=1 Tax=Sutcliffiella deserti TaxID=2875501 RepID=UPI001CC18E55|nr:VTT domain-containing protein [Sutcliffiella deserti]